jgi:hypothetical protein
LQPFRDVLEVFSDSQGAPATFRGAAQAVRGANGLTRPRQLEIANSDSCPRPTTKGLALVGNNIGLYKTEVALGLGRIVAFTTYSSTPCHIC